MCFVKKKEEKNKLSLVRKEDLHKRNDYNRILKGTVVEYKGFLKITPSKNMWLQKGNNIWGGHFPLQCKVKGRGNILKERTHKKAKKFVVHALFWEIPPGLYAWSEFHMVKQHEISFP